MDDETLFQTGDFVLSGGESSRYRIECDALTEADWAGLAVMLVECLHNPFSRVLGVPRGGLPLQRALMPHIDHNADRLLVVDDVWTTGGSMNRYVKDLNHSERYLHRAVIFARGKTPSSVVALFQMPSPNDRTPSADPKE